MMIDKNDHKQIAHLMEIGANSCIAKTWDAGEFVKAINAVQTDEFYFNEIVNTALLENTKMKNNMKLLVPVVHLSDKEITYLKLLYEEKSIKEMAVTMELSPRTVEAIRDKLKTKLGVTSTPGLVKYTIKARIVELEIPVHS
jgi:DNA-binding NarL/FixJ family response regulator